MKKTDQGNMRLQKHKYATGTVSNFQNENQDNLQ